MRRNHFDYSDELTASTDSEAIQREEARLKHLMERNDSIALAFREIKPEIQECYHSINAMAAIIKKMSATVSQLQSYFPLNLSPEDADRIRTGIFNIVDDSLADIRKDVEAAKRPADISVSKRTFWCMVMLLLWLIVFFVVAIFANINLIHSPQLTQILVIVGIAIIISLSSVFAVYRRKQRRTW